ncbi:MAG: hypothetical protein K0R24_1956 [Gammaproteobacteria bacterium]|jgi:hypothetical protein|nr:hypothetical protein [Gammaproteobacteria bacterium]
MINNTEFKITEAEKGLSPMELAFSLLSLQYNPIVLKSKNFTFNGVNNNNVTIANKKTWSLFRSFAEECQSTLSRVYRRQKVEYQSSHGFPVGILPNGTEIITIGPVIKPDGEGSIHFVWLGEEK